MHMLHYLFFIEAHFGSTLVAEHIPGVRNELADVTLPFSSFLRFRVHAEPRPQCRRSYMYIFNCSVHAMIQYIHISTC